MRELDSLREALDRASRNAMGINPYGDRRTESQARAAGMEALIASLPVDISDLEPIQDMVIGSPTEGGNFFMLSFSVLDGDDFLS